MASRRSGNGLDYSEPRAVAGAAANEPGVRVLASPSTLRTLIPALLALGLVGVMPLWVEYAQAQGHYTPGMESCQDLLD